MTEDPLDLNQRIQQWASSIPEIDDRQSLVNRLLDIKPPGLRLQLYKVCRRMLSGIHPASTITNYVKDAERVCTATQVADLNALDRQLVESKWFTAQNATAKVGRWGHTRTVEMDADRIYNHTSGMRSVMRTWYRLQKKTEDEANVLVKALFDMPKQLQDEAARLRRERHARNVARRQNVADEDLSGFQERLSMLDGTEHPLEVMMVGAIIEGLAEDDTNRRMHVLRRRRRHYAIENGKVVGIRFVEPSGTETKLSTTVHFQEPAPLTTALLDALPWKHPEAPTIFRVTEQVRKDLEDPDLPPERFPPPMRSHESKHFLKLVSRVTKRGLTQWRAFRRAPNEEDVAFRPDAELDRRNGHVVGGGTIMNYAARPRPASYKRAMYRVALVVPASRREYCHGDGLKRVGVESQCRFCNKPYEEPAADPQQARRELLASRALQFDAPEDSPPARPPS